MNDETPWATGLTVVNNNAGQADAGLALLCCACPTSDLVVDR